MRVAACAIAVLLAAGLAAEASPDQFIGRLVTDVRVETTEGLDVAAGVLDLVETRQGNGIKVAMPKTRFSGKRPTFFAVAKSS
jgi:hypothetical protein